MIRAVCVITPSVCQCLMLARSKGYVNTHVRDVPGCMMLVQCSSNGEVSGYLSSPEAPERTENKSI
jgi:hypothetical protein